MARPFDAQHEVGDAGSESAYSPSDIPSGVPVAAASIEDGNWLRQGPVPAEVGEFGEADELHEADQKKPECRRPLGNVVVGTSGSVLGIGRETGGSREA